MGNSDFIIMKITKKFMSKYGGNMVKPPMNNMYDIVSKTLSCPSAEALNKPAKTTQKINASDVAKKLFKINFHLLIRFDFL